MSGTAEGMAKRVLRWISPMEDPLYDYRLMSEFRQSHPLDANTLENSIKTKRDSTITGVYVGEVVGFLTCGGMLKSRLTRTLPVGYSYAQLLVRIIPTCVVCVTACSVFGGHVGNNWVKNPHEAEAKFHDWLQNRASAES